MGVSEQDACGTVSIRNGCFSWSYPSELEQESAELDGSFYTAHHHGSFTVSDNSLRGPEGEGPGV